MVNFATMESKFHEYDTDIKKKPVLSLQFRLAVEKQVKKFLESSEDSFEIPVFFSPNQREFIHEYSFSLGLKCKLEGKGKSHILHPFMLY